MSQPKIWFASVMIVSARHARVLARREQRRRDPRAVADDLGLERVLDVVDREAVVRARDRQRQRVADLAVERLQRAVDVREA